MFFKFVDRTATKNEIRDVLIWNAEEHGEVLSPSRANNLADKFKKGLFDPDLAKFIQHSDPTGETAARNVDRMRTLEARFWEKVDRAESCWLWTAGLSRDGYGSFSVDGHTRSAHRVAYELAVGPIPDGLQIDHLCHVPRCVNPAHLQAVTPKQNCENASAAYRNNKSGYLGVSPSKNGRWMARIYHEGKYRYGGLHDTPEQAAEAAKALRMRYFTNNLADRTTRHG